MKRILVVSDIHGASKIMKHILENVKYDLVVFAGDWCIGDNDLKSKIDFFIKGNNDWTDDPNTIYFEVEGIKFMMTHGDAYQSFIGIDKHRMLIDAKYNKAEVVIYGHSHVKDNQMIDDVLFFNPGSPSFPRDGSKGSIGFIDIESDGKITAKHIFMNDIDK